MYSIAAAVIGVFKQSDSVTGGSVYFFKNDPFL